MRKQSPTIQQHQPTNMSDPTITMRLMPIDEEVPCGAPTPAAATPSLIKHTAFQGDPCDTAANTTTISSAAQEGWWSGVIFGKTIRCGYAVLHLAASLGAAAEEGEPHCSDSRETTTQHLHQGRNEISPPHGGDASDKGGETEEEEGEEEQAYCVVRVQFVGHQVASLRSHCRRFYKLGDLIEVKRGNWTTCPSSSPPQFPLSTDHRIEHSPDLDIDPSPLRWVVDVHFEEDFDKCLQVLKPRHWGSKQYQQWQHHYLPLDPFGCKRAGVQDGPMTGDNGPLAPTEQRPFSSASHQDKIAPTPQSGNGGGDSHGSASVRSKREQAEYFVHFVLHMTMYRLLVDDGADMTHFPDPCDWGATSPQHAHPDLYRRAVDVLNAGGRGIVDAAGGSGFVSMALGRFGVRSTVVDARQGVGKLPGRERKAWNRFLKKHQQLTSELQPQDESLRLCHPVGFDALRAWFGAPPDGIDGRHRHPDLESPALPVCDEQHALLQNCSTLLALHPDEATDAVVDVAIAAKIPFAVVPCCVFSRLFPGRRTPSGDSVQARPDLLAYLAAKHPSIQQSTLPFAGANTVLWSTF